VNPSTSSAPEADIAKDLSRRALFMAPVLIGLSAVFWQLDGALSSAYALILVVSNFALAAALMAWSARISLAVFMATVLGGYVLRLALVAAAVIAVSGRSWFDAIPLGLSLIIAHLGLLVWEARYVSASLAYPGLKPSPADPSAIRRRVAAATASEEE